MKEIKKVFHIADVHIFNSKNFHVHEYVFNQFYKDIESEKPDICVIAGDVVDSKIRLSPEQVELCRNFFLNISSYCPIIIIPGNHDLNLANTDRTDSLSPIIHSLYFETIHPIHFLKHSGIFSLYGIDWAVWSCMDDQRSPFESDYKKKNYTIGLYHGVVDGCESDNGMKLSGGIDIKEFENCDCVIMGDIHKQQFFRNKEIGFSGGFLQTKTNEDTKGSYLIWGWEKNGFSPTVKRLENIYSTISHNVEDVLDTNIQLICDSNQVVVLKYDPNLISKTDMLNYKKELGSLYKNKFEVKPIVKKKNEPTYFSKEEVNAYKRLSLTDAFMQYISHHIPDVTDETKQLLVNLDEYYGKNMDISREFELGDFSLVSVIINNLLAFGPTDTIFLFDREGIYSIIGENRVGKTSVFSAIKFCMFNATPHNSTVLKKMINKHNRTKEAYVELLLSKNGKKYIIKRSITPKKDGVSIALDLDEVNDALESVKSLKGEKRQETEKEIQRLFGTESVFEILTSFSASKQQAEFINCRNAERLTLVNRYLGLQSFEEKEKEVANDLKSKKAVYAAYLKDFNQTINLHELELELDKKNIDLADNKDQLKTQEMVLAKFISQNEEFIKRWNKTKMISEKRVDSPDDIEQKIKNIDREIQVKNDSNTTNQNIIKVLEKNIEEFKINFIEQSHFYGGCDIKTWKPDHKENKELESQRSVYENDIRMLTKQLTIDICHGCGKEFTELDKINCKKKIQNCEDNNLVITAQLKTREGKRNALVDIQSEYNNTGRKLSNIQSEILRTNAEILSETMKKEKLQFQNDEYEEVQDAKKLLDILKPQLDRYNATRAENEKEIIRLNVDIRSDEGRIMNINQEILSYRTKLKQLQELEKEMMLLKSYKDIIHKDGLPLYILKSKIEGINTQTNIIINQVFEFDVQFEIDEEAGDLNINFIYPEDVENNDAGLASGAETFLINLSIKAGIAQISDIPKMDSILIDEGFGTLDSKSVGKIPQLFDAINKYYRNIITISHLDELKDMGNYPIKLEKVGKYTKVI